MAKDTIIFWKLVSCVELLSLLENTIDETIVQQATATIGFSHLVSNGKSLSQKAKADFADLIQEKSLQSAYDARALQRAIHLQAIHKPLPIKKHGTKYILLLNLLPPNKHSQELSS